MNNGKIVLSALAGVALGSLIGILFAPEKGSRTRRKLLNKGEDYVDDLKGKLADYVGNIQDKFDHTLQHAEQTLANEIGINK